MTTAWIHWHRTFDHAPDVTATCGDETREFATYAEAIEWARPRADRFHVFIDGVGEWDTEPSHAERATIEETVAAGHHRFELEQREHSEPVDWFVAYLEPEVDDVDALAAAATARPEVKTAHAHRRTHRGEPECWLVVTVAARSKQDASVTAHDAVFPLVWPPERRPKGPWMLGIGRHQVSGLAEFTRDDLG
jgi:hypothetical protein